MGLSSGAYDARVTDDVAQRERMRAFLERLEQAVNKIPTSAWAGLLEACDVAREADDWARTLGYEELVQQFRGAMVPIGLAIEDVQRLFPEDPPDAPAARRLGHLVGVLVPALRDVLAEKGSKPIH